MVHADIQPLTIWKRRREHSSQIEEDIGVNRLISTRSFRECQFLPLWSHFGDHFEVTAWMWKFFQLHMTGRIVTYLYGNLTDLEQYALVCSNSIYMLLTVPKRILHSWKWEKREIKKQADIKIDVFLSSLQPVQSSNNVPVLYEFFFAELIHLNASIYYQSFWVNFKLNSLPLKLGRSLHPCCSILFDDLLLARDISSSQKALDWIPNSVSFRICNLAELLFRPSGHESAPSPDMKRPCDGLQLH